MGKKSNLSKFSAILASVFMGLGSMGTAAQAEEPEKQETTDTQPDLEANGQELATPNEAAPAGTDNDDVAKMKAEADALVDDKNSKKFSAETMAARILSAGDLLYYSDSYDFATLTDDYSVTKEGQVVQSNSAKMTLAPGDVFVALDADGKPTDFAIFVGKTAKNADETKPCIMLGSDGIYYGDGVLKGASLQWRRYRKTYSTDVAVTSELSSDEYSDVLSLTPVEAEKFTASAHAEPADIAAEAADIEKALPLDIISNDKAKQVSNLKAEITVNASVADFNNRYYASFINVSQTGSVDKNAMSAEEFRAAIAAEIQNLMKTVAGTPNVDAVYSNNSAKILSIDVKYTPEIRSLEGKMTADKNNHLADKKNAKLLITGDYTGLDLDTSYTAKVEIHEIKNGVDQGVMYVKAKAITGSKVFTPHYDKDSVTLEIPFDGSALEAGEKLVGHLTITGGDANLSIEGEPMTVIVGVPAIEGKASAENNAVEAGNAEATVKETLDYTDFTAKAEYTATVDAYALKNGKTDDPELIGSVEHKFTPAESEGSEEIKLNVDASKLTEDDKIVLTVKLAGDGEELALDNLYDENQILSIGKAEPKPTDEPTPTDTPEPTDSPKPSENPEPTTTPETKATYTTTVSGENLKDTKNLDSSITAKFAYSDMDKSTKYRFVTEIHVKDAVTGADKGALKDITGKAIGASVDFTTDEETVSGEAEATAAFRSDLLAGTRNLVVYDYLYRVNDEGEIEGDPIMSHTDIADEALTLTVAAAPSISGKAVNKADNSNTAKAGINLTIQTTMNYKSFVPNQKYHVRAEAHSGTDGKLLTVDGKDIVREGNFTPTEADGAVTITFDSFSTAEFAEGTKIVIYETVTPIGDNGAATTDANGIRSIVHADMKDEDQTITITKVTPVLKTTATLADGKTKTVAKGADAAIIDVLDYENFVGDQTYRAEAEIHTADDSVLTYNGKKITATAEFKADKSGKGTATVKFDAFNTGSLDVGKKLVVYETVYPIDDKGNRMIDANGISSVAHKDMNDAAQTITITEALAPSIDAKATFKDTGSSSMAVTESTTSVTAVAAVTFQNVEKGKTYLLYATAVDPDTGTALSATSSVEFAATDASGTVNVPVTFDASKLAGKKAVLVEELYRKETNTKIAELKDLKDADQTLTFTYGMVNTDAGRIAIGSGIALVLAVAILVVMHIKNKSERQANMSAKN